MLVFNSKIAFFVVSIALFANLPTIDIKIEELPPDDAYDILL